MIGGRIKVWDWWKDKDMGLMEGQRYGIDGIKKNGIGGMANIWDWWKEKMWD